MTTWRRKGPKGCFARRIDKRLAFLERAKPPFDKLFWLLHAPEPGGYVTHTLAAKTREDVFVLADRLLEPGETVDTEKVLDPSVTPTA
jgi:hypothetical protein